ncbi:MAG TPA: addiction module protein [Longimicrobium sp.]|nr:addiction module protein [Longimicrobium sp.]
MEFSEIERAALQLAPDQRSRLIERLMDSLDGEEDGGRWIDVRAEQAWMVEVQRRHDAIVRGDVKLIDHDDVVRRLTARFGDPAGEEE